MRRSSKIPSNTNPDQKAPARRMSQVRTNRLKDEVYREMLLLEMDRPGAEMGLALALLRAIVCSDSLSQEGKFRDWLNSVCPVALRMIEVALGEPCKGVSERQTESCT